MDWYLTRLQFKGPLHIGRNEPGIGIEGVQPIIHSDTLFSAFCNVWADSPELKKTLDDIGKGAVPVRLSSAYFYQEKGNQVDYFLPRPLLPLSSSFEKYAPVIKKTDFLTLKQFSEWAQGRITTTGEAEGHDIGKKAHRFYREQVRPRHSSDRITMETNIYHSGEIFLEKDTGLYFIAATDDRGLLERTLELLSHRGIGGERSIGYGSFSYASPELINGESPFGKIRSVDGNSWHLLSLYHPNDGDEMNTLRDSVLAYRLVMRRGWFYSSTDRVQGRRKTCHMFSEGSIFKNRPNGKLVPVEPAGLSHHVYRSGLALCLPMNVEVDAYA